MKILDHLIEVKNSAAVLSTKVGGVGLDKRDHGVEGFKEGQILSNIFTMNSNDS